MPRTARAAVGGYCYHGIDRGNARAEVFHHEGAYHAFVRLLRQASARVPMRLLAFCLMPNHFHLALWPPGDHHLARWMDWLLTTHVRRYHKQYRTSGHVWQGRFQTFPIEQDEHLWTVLRSIERNPLRAAGWQRPEQDAKGVACIPRPLPPCSGRATRRHLLFVRVARNEVRQAADNVVRLDSLGLGVEVGDDAMAQDRGGHGAEPTGQLGLLATLSIL